MVFRVSPHVEIEVHVDECMRLRGHEFIGIRMRQDCQYNGFFRHLLCAAE